MDAAYPVDVMKAAERLGVNLMALAKESFPNCGTGASSAAEWLRDPQNVHNYLMQRCCPPQLNAEMRAHVEPGVRELAGLITSTVNWSVQLAMLGAAVQLGEKCIQPNATIGLYAHASGQLAAPNVPIPLRPRSKGVLIGTNLRYKKHWTLLRIVIDRVDCATGWSLVGDQTFGWEEFSFKPYLFDTPLTSFREDIEQKCTPLAAMCNNAPSQETDFTAQVIVDSTQDERFYGMTLQIWNAECAPQFCKFRTRFGDLNWNDLVKSLGGCVSACQQPGMAPVFGFPQPGGIMGGAPNLATLLWGR